jgi:hypothetical protein
MTKKIKHSTDTVGNSLRTRKHSAKPTSFSNLAKRIGSANGCHPPQISEPSLANIRYTPGMFQAGKSWLS